MPPVCSVLCLVLLPCLALVGKPESQPANDASSKAKPSSIQWRTDYHAARRDAEKKLPLFLYTTFETCFWAHKMEAETLSNAKIVGLLNQRSVSVKVYAERNPTAIDSLHVHSFPTTGIFSCDGKVRQTIEGYADVEHLMAGLEDVAGNATDKTPPPVMDALPRGWKLEDIAKAALPGATSGSAYVLAWKRIGDERPVLVDYCLVLTHIPDYCGRERWDICSVARNPDRDGPDGEWRVALVHYGPGYKGFDTGLWVHHQGCFYKRPSNKDVYKCADEFGWTFDVDGDWKLLDAKVCKGTWETVLKEKPTRDFPKKKEARVGSATARRNLTAFSHLLGVGNRPVSQEIRG